MALLRPVRLDRAAHFSYSTCMSTRSCLTSRMQAYAIKQRLALLLERGILASTS